jgi:hypothetical protein
LGSGTSHRHDAVFDLMTLSPPESAWPAARALLAAVVWRHEPAERCAGCSGPLLVGRLDGAPVARACHRCGPAAEPAPPPSFDTPPGA